MPTVNFNSLSDFRRYISACPDANYAWRFYGKLEIISAGTYSLCTTSDDGSLLYADLNLADKASKKSCLSLSGSSECLEATRQNSNITVDVTSIFCNYSINHCKMM